MYVCTYLTTMCLCLLNMAGEKENGKGVFQQSISIDSHPFCLLIKSHTKEIKLYIL